MFCCLELMCYACQQTKPNLILNKINIIMLSSWQLASFITDATCRSQLDQNKKYSHNQNTHWNSWHTRNLAFFSKLSQDVCIFIKLFRSLCQHGLCNLLWPNKTFFVEKCLNLLSQHTSFKSKFLTVTMTITVYWCVTGDLSDPKVEEGAYVHLLSLEYLTISKYYYYTTCHMDLCPHVGIAGMVNCNW